MNYLFVLSELAENLFENLGFSQRDATIMVESFFEEITNSLTNGEQVKLSGFGNFDLRETNERPGRNPKTGEYIPISARRVVSFRPGQTLTAGIENVQMAAESSSEVAVGMTKR
jgi:integration host factor subunit alpha